MLLHLKQLFDVHVGVETPQYFVLVKLLHSAANQEVTSSIVCSSKLVKYYLDVCWKALPQISQTERGMMKNESCSRLFFPTKDFVSELTFSTWRRLFNNFQILKFFLKNTGKHFKTFFGGVCPPTLWKFREHLALKISTPSFSLSKLPTLGDAKLAE